MVTCNKNLAARLIAEMLGSMLVQCIGCCYSGLSVTSARSTLDQLFNPGREYVPKFQGTSLGYAFTWGGLILAGTMAFRIVSGAHLNPIISVASIIIRNIKLVDGLLYIVMQLGGSCLGYCIAFAMYGNLLSETQFCVTEVSSVWWMALVVEFYISGAWVLAFCSSVHESNQPPNESVSLKIGFVVICATLVGTQYSQSCMNPFRSLWPALFHGFYKHIYIYVGIPIGASISLAFAWRYLYLMNADETVSGPGGPDKD
ncbi:PREDICTED: putative aquaporin NIP4-1 [Drosophila arizonae]|uniref:Aquaporin NIP4-1 n=1 Tax=Drosophila arizonae TaxID=7263 RepID=A0ABM1PHZ0_DROAR|nr:PREDICTED: putative aquaporin NIP4-1 [Drosophila arizonae]